MPAGRPLELTRDMIETVKTLLPRSLYVETVADVLGVHRVTFRRWVKAGAVEQRHRDRGKPPNPKFNLHCELCITVKKAMGQTEADFLSQIQTAGIDTWQALAWVLERRFPDKWGLNRAEVRELKRRLDELEKSSVKSAPAEGADRTSRRPRSSGAAR
jgi:transposase